MLFLEIFYKELIIKVINTSLLAVPEPGTGSAEACQQWVARRSGWRLPGVVTKLSGTWWRFRTAIK
jgi:hypothetical protein